MMKEARQSAISSTRADNLHFLAQNGARGVDGIVHMPGPGFIDDAGFGSMLVQP